MNETERNRRGAPRDAKASVPGKTTVHASASEATRTTDDGGDPATTSRTGSRFSSPMSAPMPRFEPTNRRWLVAVLVIATIALVLGMAIIIEIKAGLITFD